MDNDIQEFIGLIIAIFCYLGCMMVIAILFIGIVLSLLCTIYLGFMLHPIIGLILIPIIFFSIKELLEE